MSFVSGAGHMSHAGQVRDHLPDAQYVVSVLGAMGWDVPFEYDLRRLGYLKLRPLR